MQNRILSLVILLGSGVFMVSCGNLKEPDFKSVENVRMGQVGLKESTVNLDVHYFNPNNSRLMLKEAGGDAWLDDVYLGKFMVDSLIHIPANADFSIPVKLNIDMSHFLLSSISSYLDREVLVRIEGKAKVGKGGFFIRYPIRYEGKQDLRTLLKNGMSN